MEPTTGKLIIAQELCDQICKESPLKQPKHSAHESYRKLDQATSSRYDRRPTRTVLVEKKRVINKVVPSSHSKSKIVINKFKSKDTLLKKTYIDSGFNTVITGPLRCDNDCVTMVRKRDYSRGICVRCANKRSNCKLSVKEIQTFDKPFTHMDKACAQCVETVNCSNSIQVFEKLGSRKVLLPNIISRVKLCNDVNTQTVEVTKENEKDKNDVPSTKSKIDYNFMGARRWALSQYPTRGPDF